MGLLNNINESLKTLKDLLILTYWVNSSNGRVLR